MRVVFEPDPEPNASYLEQSEFEDRHDAYKREEWSLIGCRVEADVTIVETPQTLKSAGLWGIESDSEQDELDEIAHREWSQLRDVLKQVGIPTAELPLEIERKWIEWRM